MNALPIILGIVGAMIPLMVLFSSILSQNAGSVYPATLTLILVALVTLVAKVIIGGHALTFPGGNPVFYLSGVIFVIYITTVIKFSPRIGVGKTILFMTTGQLLSIALIEHWGSLGMAPRSMNIRSITGLGMVFIGVFLYTR